MITNQDQLDQLDAEIEELERLVTPQDQEGQDGATPQLPPEQLEYVDVQTVPGDELPPQQVVPPRPDLEDELNKLNNRYVKLRQSSDNYKYETKQQIASLQEAIVSLQEENEQLRNVIAEYEESAGKGQLNIVEHFAQEDIDVLGEGTIKSFQAAIANAVEAATKPLKAELLSVKKAERDRLKLQAQNNRSQAYTSFEEQLGRLVPNFRQINVDKGFIEWLRQPSQYTGVIRLDYFRKAEQAGDVERVAQYFIEYQQLTSSTDQLMAESVTPSGRGGGGKAQLPPQQQGQKKVFSIAFVNKFYDDDIKGLYKGRETLRDQLDREIDLALREGRVR